MLWMSLRARIKGIMVARVLLSTRADEVAVRSHARERRASPRAVAVAQVENIRLISTSKIWHSTYRMSSRGERQRVDALRCQTTNETERHTRAPSHPEDVYVRPWSI